MTRGARAINLAFVTLVFTGCARYSVRRAALVPQPTPVFRSGQPMDRIAELGVGVGTLARAQEPQEGSAEDGLQIPRVQVGGNLRFRLTPNFDMGLIVERASQAGATALADDQPTPEGDASGHGISVQYSLETDDIPGLRIAVAADLLLYSIPNVEYRTCFENCDAVGTYTSVEYKRTVVPVHALALTPSWQHQDWTLYGGMTLRNHPTIERGGIEGPYDSDDLEAGPLNVVLSAGVERHLGRGVRAALVLYQVTGKKPVQYAPTVAATLTIPLAAGDGSDSRARL